MERIGVVSEPLSRERFWQEAILRAFETLLQKRLAEGGIVGARNDATYLSKAAVEFAEALVEAHGPSLTFKKRSE